jgi:hypothetical protein
VSDYLWLESLQELILRVEIRLEKLSTRLVFVRQTATEAVDRLLISLDVEIDGNTVDMVD